MSAIHERYEDLLSVRATVGLTPEERHEYDGLRASNPEFDHEGYELAAAAVHLALLETEVMPSPLRDRVEADAIEFFAAPELATPRPPGRVPRAWFAVAASVALAVLGWFALRPGDAPTLETQRAAFVSAAADLVSLEFAATDDPSAVDATGDLVWSDAEQRGFMRLRGLAVNDPSRAQYQLWVFDSSRDERYPVDGGVFDIDDASGEVIVPIDAKLPVSHATLFAVTVEQPGGVVVSSRDRIALLAQL